jgi:ABC-type antimicrobial peptide transport system permease subunit
MWPLIRFVSLRHIVAAKARSLLTLLGVALGVAMLVGMTAANESVMASFLEMVDRASGKADLGNDPPCEGRMSRVIARRISAKGR